MPTTCVYHLVVSPINMMSRTGISKAQQYCSTAMELGIQEPSLLDELLTLNNNSLLLISPWLRILTHYALVPMCIPYQTHLIMCSPVVDTGIKPLFSSLTFAGVTARA